MPTDPNAEDLFNARRGDRDALDRLLAKYQDQFRNMAHFELGPALRARVHTSDLLQSAFLDVVRSMETFEGETEEQFVRWFGRILDHNIRDRARYFDAQKRKGGDPGTVSSIPDQGPTPSAEIGLREDQAQISNEIEEALKALSEDQRRVLQLRFKDGLTHKEIADELGRTPEAVRVLVWRARSALALQLRKNSSEKLEK